MANRVAVGHTPTARNQILGKVLLDLAGAAVAFGVLLSPLPFSIAAIAGGVGAILFARPQVILLVGMTAVPLSGGSPEAMNILWLFLTMLTISCVRHLQELKTARPPPVAVILPILVLWVVLSTVLTPAGPFGSISPSEVIQPIVGATVAFAAALFAIRPRELAMAAVPGSLLVSISTLQASGSLDGRVQALGLNSNYLALLIVLMLAAVLVGGLSTQLTILTALTVWPVGLAALARTQSRAAFIALAVVICVLFLSRRRDRLVEHRRLLVVVVGVAIIIVTFPGLVDSLGANFLSHRTAVDFASSDQQRNDALFASLRMFVDHPVFGVGYGHFVSIAASTELGYVNTHNEYTRFAAELGAAGLVMLLIPLVTAIASATRERSRNVLAVLLAMSVAILTGNFLNSIVTAYPFWIALGMGLSMRQPLRADSTRMGPG